MPGNFKQRIIARKKLTLEKENFENFKDLHVMRSLNVDFGNCRIKND